MPTAVEFAVAERCRKVRSILVWVGGGPPGEADPGKDAGPWQPTPPEQQNTQFRTRVAESSGWRAIPG